MARGSVKRRHSGSWAIILELGYETDPATGKRKRHQKWINFKTEPTLPLDEQRKLADAKLIELLHARNVGTFVEASKITLVDWLRTWLDQSVKSKNAPQTHRIYKGIIENHIAKSRIAFVPVQRLRDVDLERYLAELPLAPSSVAIHHAVLHRSLAKAVKSRLITTSPALDLDRPTATPDPAVAARVHCWTAHEATTFLATARTASPQVSAFMHLALDAGARKSELYAIGWSHLDLETGTVVIERQLRRAGVKPDFGPTKTKRVRSVELGAETVAALRAHRQSQNELKLKNRPSYEDFSLVFAKEVEDLVKPADALGQPLTTLSENRFERLTEQAGVKRIKFHGCRHTSATLDLLAGTPPHVVAARLGHSVMMLLKTYAHALPDQQKAAAARRGDMLHGR